MFYPPTNDSFLHNLNTNADISIKMSDLTYTIVQQWSFGWLGNFENFTCTETKYMELHIEFLPAFKEKSLLFCKILYRNYTQSVLCTNNRGEKYKYIFV